MRCMPSRAWMAIAWFAFAVPVHASSPVPVAIGSSRGGPLHDLQQKVDALVGPGRVNVLTDFVGGREGDPDPWSWTNPGHAMVVQLVDRESPNFEVGWYDESTGPRATAGMPEGLVLERTRVRGTRAGFALPRGVQRFGLFAEVVDPSGRHHDRHFSNRLRNLPGHDGAPAAQPPFDGDPQMLVFDVSRWLGAGTWLVACEMDDAGLRMGLADGESDHDYSDLLFLFSGASATPVQSQTFGRLKRLYR